MQTMRYDNLPRIVGFSGIAVAAILLGGLTGLNWYIVLTLTFLASAFLVAGTR